MTDFDAKLGKRADEAGHDPASVGDGSRPETTEVSGQTMTMNANIYICPECWTMNDVALDPIRVAFYRCWACGAFLQI